MSLPWSASWRARSRRTVLIAFAAAVSVLAGGCTAAYTYDRSRSTVLIDGTTIGGVRVGGLSADAAGTRLRRVLEEPLRAPMAIGGAGFETVKSPWDLGMRMDVDGAVRSALSRQRDGNVIRRLWRSMTDSGPDRFALKPSLDTEPVKELIDDAAAAVYVEPRSARLRVVDGWVRITPGRLGRSLEKAEARKKLLEAIREGRDEVTLPVSNVEPGVPTSAYETVILVHTGSNKLYLYKHGRIARSFSVASGTGDHPTPHGTFRIVRKRKNPTWINPGSAWANDMPARIGPGPNNPLGTRALDLNASGIRIHGTPNSGSIGRAASHGCIRMHIGDAEELFGLVDTGTAVVITGN